MLRKIMTVLFVPVLLYGVASAQTVDELIAKNTKARGGIEKIRAVKSMKLTGTLSVQGMEIQATMLYKRPNMIRSESVVQGTTIVQGYDGTTAWMVSPFTGQTGPVKLAGEDAKDIAEQSDADGPFIDYKKKGNQIELMGKDIMDSTSVYKLKVTLKNGDVHYYYLDAARGLEVKDTFKRQVQGNEVEVETYYADYKPVGGVMIAHAIDNKIKGQTVSRVVLNKIEMNVDAADSLFKMPPPVAGGAADTTAGAPVNTETKPDSAKK